MRRRLTSLLLAGEEATVFRDGKRYALPPISERREVDFGPGLGRKGIYLYNLPEVLSSHVHMKARARGGAAHGVFEGGAYGC